MASKLRRTPLFGYDGNLGIPILPAANSAASAGVGAPAGSGKKAAQYGYQVGLKKNTLRVLSGAI